MKSVVLTGLNFMQFCAMGLGHLKAFAEQSEIVRANFDIEILEYPSEASEAEVAEAICSRKPTIAGFTVQHGLASKISRISTLVKQEMPGTTIVWGGSDIAGDVEAVVHEHSSFDIAVRGEGEHTFVEILEHFSGHRPELATIAGITFRRDGVVASMPDRPPEEHLEVFPSPYLAGTLDPRNYPIAHVETYRGCPFKCRFCYEHRGFQRVRLFPVKRVVQELDFLVESGVTAIKFFDTVFTYKKDRILQILQFLEKNGRGIYVSGETSVELVDDEIAAAMSRAGVPKLEIGLQSINEATLASLGRPFSRAVFEDCVRRLQRHCITPLIHVMAALPGETYEDLRRSVDYVYSLGGVPTVFHTKILPGTPLHRQAAALEVASRGDGMREVLSTPQLPPPDLARFLEVNRVFGSLTAVSFAVPTICHHLGVAPFALAEELAQWVEQGGELTTTLERPAAWLLPFLEDRFGLCEEDDVSSLRDFAEYCLWEWQMRQPFFGRNLPPAFWKEYDIDFEDREMWYPEVVDLSGLRRARTRVCYFRTKNGRHRKETMRVG